MRAVLPGDCVSTIDSLPVCLSARHDWRVVSFRKHTYLSVRAATCGLATRNGNENVQAPRILAKSGSASSQRKRKTLDGLERLWPWRPPLCSRHRAATAS